MKKRIEEDNKIGNRRKNKRELVIAHKDRLTRFGYELIRDIIKEYSGVEIRILEESKIDTKEEEIVKDVLQILNVYVSKLTILGLKYIFIYQ